MLGKFQPLQISKVTNTLQECLTFLFYCTTIAYHVELNADLGWPQASGHRPRKIDI